MKKCIIILVSILFSCCIYTNNAAAIESIPITINYPEQSVKSWPIATGVPFPKKTLSDIKQLVLREENGTAVPCQIDVTATWLDGSIRWVLLNFHGFQSKQYHLTIDETFPTEQTINGISITEDNHGVTIDTGAGTFSINNDDALITNAVIQNKRILYQSGKGATVIDNQGNKAVFGGKSSELSTSFLVKGPMWTVIRKEGWYISENKSEKIARGIIWMHFYANSPYVKIVHQLVLTEDTNKVWFKNIQIHFSTMLQEQSTALFDISNHDTGQVIEIPVTENEQTSMAQTDFPHFMSKSSNFSLIHRKNTIDTTIQSGTACGDWCSLRSPQQSLTIVLQDLAEQFPKELTVSKSGITAALWSERGGKELDFRTETLVKDYWGKWTNYADIGESGVLTIPSNAQASAKTHTLWVLPHTANQTIKEIESIANTASRGVISLPGNKWLCDSGTMGPPMLPKDTQQFPVAEKFISDFFDKTVLVPQHLFPLTGYIAWGSNPATRYNKDPETNEYYATWWRISGLVDYHLRKNVWTLYARSGERKYFDYGTKFNRFAGDMNMHHWDYGPVGNYKDRSWKVKGGFAYGLLPNNLNLKGGEGVGSYPIYWRWVSGKPDGSGADISNYLLQFYLTGDWEMWELAKNFGEAVKKYSFLQTPESRRGAFVPLRYLTWLYSMNWDPELGKQLHSLAEDIIDLNSPNGVSLNMPPGPLYKISRNAIALLDYYRLTEAPLAREGFLKMIDYQYRFELGDYAKPIAYQNASGMYYTMAWRMTGEDKYLQLARRSMEASTSQYKEILKSSKGSPEYYGQSFNYHACLSLPIIMKGLKDYKGIVKQLPVLKKVFDSTSVSMAVFEKSPGQALNIEVLFNVAQEDHVTPILLGPDQKPVKNHHILKVEKRLAQRDVPGITPFYYHLEIPASNIAGTYRLGHDNRGDFTILNTNAKHIVLECPEGFWLEKDEPFFFFVDSKLTHINLFANKEVTITKSNQTPAVESTGKTYGDLSIPTNGTNGLWKIQSEDPAFVKFKDITPYIAFLSPDRYFFPTSPKLPNQYGTQNTSTSAQATQLKSNEGIQLTGDQTIRFPRGKSLSDGSYENFPGLKGTIEFYYKPDWSAVDLLIPGKRDLSIPLLSAGDIQIRYRYGQGHRFYAFLDFLCGTSKYAKRENKTKFGTHARLFPKQGQWIHIAVTWDATATTDTTKEHGAQKYSHAREIFHIFINGKKYKRIWSFPSKLHSRLGKQATNDFSLANIPEWIALGPGSGTYQVLRISDIVRYEDNFVPFVIPDKQDKSTKVLLQTNEILGALNRQGKKIPVKCKKF
ncbi:hypothetical protein UWK_01807 [Desulfocapsa sulfexigens DSM 10523]|uniref:LamG-like jellyroll fold domain-containing protein n=1 Tax=Desulfocapsa sulfexigens (strain DSM 10523 / SB164P1) TaxID=1167006 RepID=M1PFA0_DESSD|nr:hypothetical protein [Desulfocapsa sulfexigens]AGF78365.1 hypothetical protein UWK_01807 [Desulfocapsa sulfexigens DSM 10523]